MFLCTIAIAFIVFHYTKFSSYDAASMAVQAVRLRLVFRLFPGLPSFIIQRKFWYTEEEEEEEQQQQPQPDVRSMS
jgi:hypothetical protein